MELYAKGQLSYLILTCLKERDFYGLDIISEITKKSNGRINLKKPSVYSNLTRMEKQGYISAYLQSSDFGPNRKYYSLTENGRNFYNELKEYFERNNIDVFRDFTDSDSPVQTQTPSYEVKEEVKEEKVEDEIVNITSNDEDFFDFSSIDSSEEKTEEYVETLEETNSIEENSDKEEVLNINENIEEEVIEESPVMTQEQQIVEKEAIDSPVLEEESTLNLNEFKEEQQDTASIDEYNKRLYDISKDINKYKRKRSFAEDQIAMTATAPLNDSNERSKANLEEFKSSFLENKNKYQEERLTNIDFSRYTNANRTFVKEEQPKQEEIKNDAVFITERFNSSDFEKPRKIEPPRLKINTDAVKETKLPAPKRDLTIDPSHKEILTKLYSKTKDGTHEEVREDALYDFNDLKKYYSKQNIAFNEYKKTSEKVEHNTNKLYLITSVITFALAAVLSSLLYLILLKTSFTYVNTNFLFILLPALLVLDVVWKLYNFKQYKGWLPSKLMPQWQVWGIFILICGAVIGLNFACGMNTENFTLYATTTILPLTIAFLLVPVRYYLKRILLVKYWK